MAVDIAIEADASVQLSQEDMQTVLMMAFLELLALNGGIFEMPTALLQRPSTRKVDFDWNTPGVVRVTLRPDNVQ